MNYTALVRVFHLLFGVVVVATSALLGTTVGLLVRRWWR